MGSKVPPTTPSRRPATNRAYPGPGVPAREDRPGGPNPGSPAGRPGSRGPPRPAPPCSRSLFRPVASRPVGPVPWPASAPRCPTRGRGWGYARAPKLKCRGMRLFTHLERPQVDRSPHRQVERPTRSPVDDRDGAGSLLAATWVRSEGRDEVGELGGGAALDHVDHLALAGGGRGAPPPPP